MVSFDGLTIFYTVQCTYTQIQFSALTHKIDLQVQFPTNTHTHIYIFATHTHTHRENTRARIRITNSSPFWHAHYEHMCVACGRPEPGESVSARVPAVPHMYNSSRPAWPGHSSPAAAPICRPDLDHGSRSGRRALVGSAWMIRVGGGGGCGARAGQRGPPLAGSVQEGGVGGGVCAALALI